MDQSIDINSGDWKQRNEFMYYSHEKDSWYCTKCNLLIKSPRPARTHAEEHNLTLPCSRKKPVAPKNQLVKEELSERTRKAFEEFEQAIENSTRKEKDRVYNPPPGQYPQNSSTNFVPTTPLDREIEKRLKGKLIVERMRRTGCFSEEEIKEKEIEFGLRPKENPSKNDYIKNAAIMALQKRCCDEDNPTEQRVILMAMELVEQEKDPQKIPLILSMLPYPEPKRSKFSEKIYEKCLEYLEREEKRPDLFESANKFLDILQNLRKKPSHDESPNENFTPPNPSDNSLDQNVKP